MEPQIRVVRHVSLRVLKGLIRKEKDNHVLRRLLFIRQLYGGVGVEQACEIMQIEDLQYTISGFARNVWNMCIKADWLHVDRPVEYRRLRRG